MLNNESIRFERLIIFAVSDPVAFRAFAKGDRNFKEGLGHENNRDEPIFLAKFRDMPFVVFAGFLEDQDYVIQLDPQEPVSNGRRMAFRIDRFGASIPLGPMTKVSEDVAKDRPAWSSFPNAEGDVEYWVAKSETPLSCGKWSDQSEEKAEGFSEPKRGADVAGIQPAKSPLNDFDIERDITETLEAVFGQGAVFVIDENTDFDKLDIDAAFGEPSDLGAGGNEPAFVEPAGPGGCGARKTAPVPDTASVRNPSKSCLDKYAPSKGATSTYGAFEEGSMIGTLGAHVEGSRIFGDTTAIPDPHAPKPDFSTLVDTNVSLNDGFGDDTPLAPRVLDHDAIDARLARMQLDIDGLRDTLTVLEAALTVTIPNAIRRSRNGDYLSVG